MRILIHSINFSPELTGIGKYTGEMATWLAGRGHEVRVVTAPPHYPQWRVFEGHSAWRSSRQQIPCEGPGTIDVFRCPVWIPRAPRSWKRVLHLLSFSLGSWPAMLRQISWRPDVVLLIAPTLFCSPQALCVARLSDATGWLHVQDFEVDAAFELRDFSSVSLRRSVQMLERFLIRKFDMVSAISERMVERLALKGIDPSRATLFPNWVDTSVIYPLSPGRSPLRRELGIAEDAVVALYSGSMGKKQGLEMLVQASRQLAARPDIRFVFCGDGPDHETFTQTAKKSGRVILLPLQAADRLNDLLNLADVHLLPQLADAADLMMPSKLTGMMASGRAILATARVGTQLATVLDGRGVITPPGDVEAFIKALVQLVDDGEMRQRMGEEARKYAIDHMDQDQILSRFERSLLIASGHAPRTEQEFSARRRGRAAVVENFAIIPGKAGDD